MSLKAVVSIALRCDAGLLRGLSAMTGMMRVPSEINPRTLTAQPKLILGWSWRKAMGKTILEVKCELEAKICYKNAREELTQQHRRRLHQYR